MAKTSADINKLILAQQVEIENALPTGISAARMGAIARTAMKRNESLARCSDTSILGSLMLCFQLGLEPNTPLGHAYLVPIGGQCELWIGFKGYLKLAYASGSFLHIGAREVYEDDELCLEYGMFPVCEHTPKGKKHLEEKPISYYATYRLKEAGGDVSAMTYSEAAAHGKKYSKTFGRGPWSTDFDEMAKKTVLKKVLKYAPMSVEVSKAYNYEGKPLLFSDGVVLPNEDETDVDTIDTEAQDASGSDMEAGTAMIKKLAEKIAVPNA